MLDSLKSIIYYLIYAILIKSKRRKVQQLQIHVLSAVTLARPISIDKPIGEILKSRISRI